MEQVPVVSFNTVGLRRIQAFKITPQMGMRLAVGVVYGDLIMRVLFMLPDLTKGTGDLSGHLRQVARQNRQKRNPLFNKRDYYANLKGITEDFDRVERTGEKETEGGG